MAYMAILESLGSGLLTNALTGGGANYPSVTQLPQQGDAAATALEGIGNLDTGYNATLPMDLAYLTSVANNPYASTRIGGANNAATALNTGAGAALNAGLEGYGAADALLNTGFDPQNALYNRNFNQNQQQNLALINSMGLGTSPYGAGVVGQADENFNLDWNNQQLQRQLAAMQGFTQGAQGAGSQIQGAAGMFSGAGSLPYEAYQGINQDQLGALQAYQAALTGASAIPQQQITDLLQYLGQGASNANVGINAANAQNDQQQKAASGLYPLVNQGVQAGLNYFTSPNYNAPQASFSGDLAQPVQPIDTGITSQTLPYIPTSDYLQ